ncbi:acyl-CoA dehydrogenase family protein [Rhodococcus sp. IEGM1428]|uniref:acyl-CoA dehydrogenase family protein n=1 Tax=Rhodococcus sp. IEGM1428 TaxID=3392191 RepID=UPI003D105B94
MDFNFTPEHREFLAEVEEFLDAYEDQTAFDPTRENGAQLVDTPERRTLMGELAKKGWLGITWPEEWGGQDKDGIYEYLLNEALAQRGGPQIGKGVGIIGKTLLRHGSEKLQKEFLPQIRDAEIEFAVGYSEPEAGSDAASMRLRAVRDGDGWRLNGEKTWTTSAHFAEWYWLGARTDFDAPKHNGITLFLVPMDHQGITVQAIGTIGHERTNSVFLDNVWVSDDYVVGEVNSGFQYICEALDLERFTMFTLSPILARMELLIDYVRTNERNGRPLSEDTGVRREIARLLTHAEMARMLGLRFVDASSRPGPAPTVLASEYKLYSTEFSKELANASMDIGGSGAQLVVGTEDAPMAGRSESTYRYTVIDTIGGGASEIQKNIIARRGLGLPKTF